MPRSSPRIRSAALFAGSILALMLSSQFATAQSIEQFYRGKQVVLIVGNAAGSGYDAAGRLVANHIGKHLPGKPTVIVRNMPGGGGITGANYIANVAEKDGSVIGVVNREAILDPLFSGDKSKANYDSRKFLWLGTPNEEVGIVFVSTASGIKSIEDATKREVAVGATGATSGSAVFARLVNGLLDTKFKIVVGYPGSMDIILAMERGEVGGSVQSGWGGPLRVRVNELIKEGKARLLLQMALHKDPGNPEVPLILDIAKSADDKKLMELLFVGQSLGRPFFAPPGVPADRAKALQDAFAATMKDPDFVKEAEAQMFDVAPLLGPDMAKLIERTYATPKDLVQKAIAVMNAASQK